MLSVVAAVFLAAWGGSTWSARSAARTDAVARDGRRGGPAPAGGRHAGSRRRAVRKRGGDGRPDWWRWWGSGVGVGTTRRRRVGRPTATLIFAGRNRTAGMRSRVLLTRACPADHVRRDRCRCP